MSMQELLEQSGLSLSEAAFLDLVSEALTSVRSRRSAVSAQHEFPSSELATLRRGGFSLRAPDLDPLAATAASYVALLEDCATVAEAARQLKVDASRVRQQLLARTLFGVKVRGEWRIPRFQLGVGGIGGVVQALPPDLHPVEVWRWFTTAIPELEVAGEPASPLEWLSSGGDPAAAAALAVDL